MKKRMFTGIAGGLAVSALALAGCSSSGDTAAETDQSSATETTEAAAGGEVTIGMFNWDEAIAVSHLWKNVLENEGYEVDIKSADPGPVFQGLADGDYDVVFDVWLPLTHASYIERYGDDIVEMGAWNDEAKLTIATNADAPVDSLADLADNADVYKNKLVGIEAGAGLTMTTEDAVIPTYGLDGMEYIISSTPAMLTELDTAMNKGEDVLVTLWKPHWAYDAYDLKDLEDPEMTLGEAESIYTYSSKMFPEEHPEVTKWLQGFKMDTSLLASLENEMFNVNTDSERYDEVVANWMTDNQEYVDSLTS